MVYKMKLDQKNILITGANGGIGKEFAKMCAQHSTHLYLVMRNENPQLVSELLASGAQTVNTFLADLSNPEQVFSVCEKTKKLSIDVVFNNAGLLTGGLIENQPWGDIEKMLQVNVHAVIRLTQALIPGMIERGSGKIVNNSSVSGVMYFPCASTYAASKAAVVAFTECLEVELRGTGVTTLLLITPGIKTKMYDQIKPLYGKNLDVPEGYISPEAYASQIEQAIIDDEVILTPSLLSSPGIGLLVARYTRNLFKFSVQRRFHR
jgi:short-subunit dehydrogenase